MSLPKFDKKIRKLRSKENKLITKMENRRQEFIKTTEKFISNWYSKYVENVAKSYPEVTKSIDLDGVKSIKSELLELIKEVQVIVEQELSRKELWSHFYQETQIALEDFIYSVKRPRMLDDVIRSLLSGAVSLLVKHGYEKATHELDTILRNPLRRDDRLDWSSAMDATVGTYSDLHKQLSDITFKIQNTEREKLLAEAEDLWKRA
jgi:hypothetical protein